MRKRLPISRYDELQAGTSFTQFWHLRSVVLPELRGACFSLLFKIGNLIRDDFYDDFCPLNNLRSIRGRYGVQ